MALHAWLEGALEEGGQGVEVASDRAKQRSRADLGLQAFEADGDVLKLADGLAVDAAWLVKRGGQPLPGLSRAEVTAAPVTAPRPWRKVRRRMSSSVSSWGDVGTNPNSSAVAS